MEEHLFLSEIDFLIARYFSIGGTLASIRHAHALHSKCKKNKRISKIYLVGLLMYVKFLKSKNLYVILRIENTTDQNVQFRFSHFYIVSIRHSTYFQILPETY